MNSRFSDAGHGCPWGPRAGRLLAIVFALMFVCIIFDREAVKILNVLAWLTLVIAAVTDRHARRRSHIFPVIGGLALVLASAGVAAWFGGDFPEAVYAFIKYQVGVIWLAVLWLAMPVFLHPRWRKTDPVGNCRCAGRWATALTITLLLFAFHATISAAASMFPKDSMDLLGAEILPYAGLFIVIMRSAWCMREDWWRMGGRVIWGLSVAASIGMAFVAMAALMSSGFADSLLNNGYFRIDDYAPNTRRLQFLFQHHNRAGFFAACGIFLCLAGAWGGRQWRIIGIIGCAAAALALPFTLTRGALVAAGIGMAIFAVIGLGRYRRGRWGLLAGVISALGIFWFVLPDSYSDHIAKITNPSNYQDDSDSSIGARLIMWETALDMIERRPMLGFGYGFENFEHAARIDNPGYPKFFAGASHAHNHWLETAAETGLPGFMLLLAFTVLRIGGLMRACVQGARRKYPLAWLLLLWLCLECMIQIYGLTNYSLRRNLGFLTYAIWAGSAVLVIMAARDGESFEKRDPLQ